MRQAPQHPNRASTPLPAATRCRAAHRLNRARTVLLLAALLLPSLLGHPRSAAAAEQFPSSPNHRGVAPFEPYMVFPENRRGNGVYLDNLLIFEAEDLTIVDVAGLPVDGRFVYYALDSAGKGSLGASVGSDDPAPRIEEVAPGFFHAVMVLGGVVYKKMYRIIDNNVLDLLPSSKTADGPVAGPTGIVFYHVATAVRDDANGQARSAFGLRLHLAPYDDERTRHLDFLITNGLPRLDITWIDETRIQIGLTEGRAETLSVSQFQ